MLREVVIQKLSKEAFAKYGTAIEIPSENAEMITEQSNFWPRLGIMKTMSEFQVGISTLFKRPYRFDRMERHLKTMELMIPLNGTILIPFTPYKGFDLDETPNPEEVEIFEINPCQAVILKRGVWHWSPMPTSNKVSEIVIFDKETEKKDLIVKYFPDGTVIEAKEEIGEKGKK